MTNTLPALTAALVAAMALAAPGAASALPASFLAFPSAPLRLCVMPASAALDEDHHHAEAQRRTEMREQAEGDAAAADLALYRQHVETLANPFMEGRGPGTRGNRLAAEYFQWQFERMGLRPAFPGGDAEPSAPAGFMQEFTAGREARAGASEVVVTAAAVGEPEATRRVLRAGADYTVLGNSGTGTVEGEVVFVGYSLDAEAKAGFASYTEGDDLTGKVALMLRFEPMNEAGRSLLTESGAWSAAAGISGKIRAAVDRGAAGIIIVSPPGAADPRAGRLETTAASALWTRPLAVPAVMLSAAAAESLMDGADHGARSLTDLRRLADAPAEEGGARVSRLIAMGKARVSITAAVEMAPRTTWNIGAVLPGRGELADEYIVVGGHYDHVGYGYTGGSRSGEVGVIHPGADDNASGAAGVLLAAKLLSRELAAESENGGGGPRRSVMFLAFSAEEMGLIGSRAFVKDSPVSASSIYAMLNMDMIGRMRGNTLELAGTGTAEGLAELIQPMLDGSGFVVKASPGGRGPSDHATFYGAGVPVLHFFTGLHAEYHTPKDTADLIEHEGAMGIVRTVCEVATLMAHRTEPLRFTPTDRRGVAAARPADGENPPDADAPPRASVRVRLGVRPDNYAGEEEGVLVGEVTDGTSAAEAGIAAGDLLTAWNGQPMVDAGAMMDFLREHKPGDVVDVTLKRKGEEVVARVTLKARDQAAK